MGTFSAKRTKLSDWFLVDATDRVLGRVAPKSPAVCATPGTLHVDTGGLHNRGGQRGKIRVASSKAEVNVLPPQWLSWWALRN
jgi:hypothetical protein